MPLVTITNNRLKEVKTTFTTDLDENSYGKKLWTWITPKDCCKLHSFVMEKTFCLRGSQE